MIVGGGHNGLAAAVVLADAGWDVVVLERNEQPGGAVRTSEITLPGFHHDLMAMNLNLFAGSPFFARYSERLMANGLEFVPSSRPVCSLFPDGSHVAISTDLAATLESIRGVSDRDAEAFEALLARFQREAPHLFGLLGTPLPSAAAIRALWGGSRDLGRHWLFEMARLVLQSPREFVSEHFESPQVRALVATWGMHLDLPPDVSGGALFPYLETMASQANGMVIGRGGAGNMIDALVGLLEELGGEVRCGVEVDRIIVENGRAVGAAAGEVRYEADRAVIANLTPTVLFDSLVETTHVPDDFRRKVDGYRYGPGTLMMHLAMSGPAPWREPIAAEHAYVHVAGHLDDMALAYHQAIAGRLPSRPTLVVGQPTVVDPTRSPSDHHILWVQVRMVPSSIEGDAEGRIHATGWDQAADPFADRVMGILEEYAPGLGQRVLGRHVMSPVDLEAINPNLVGGDQLGGSHHVMQHFVLRPFPGWTRYETPIDGLFMCGSATWPGAGVGAGSGMLLGSRLTSEGLLSKLRR